MGVAVAVAAAFSVVGAVSWTTAGHVGRLASEEHRSVELREHYLRSDVQVGFLRGQAYEIAAATKDEARREADDELRETIVELERLQTIILRRTPAELLTDAQQFRTDTDALVHAVETLSASGVVGPASVNALQAIDAQFDDLNAELASLLTELQDRQEQAIADTARARRLAVVAVVVASLVGLGVVVVLLGFTVRSILRGLREVSNAAIALAEGDLAARVDDGRRDEIGQVGAAFNATADAMQEMVRRLAEQGRRDAFARDLIEALEMADTEERVYGVLARAMVTVSDDRPTELLLADSSRAHLERRVQHPNAGAAGCVVESPFACVAVRRGSATTFADSSALSACPNLRSSSAEPCSAVCVPVSFMGRSLGVLHTTAPVGTVLDSEGLSRLMSVAGAAGTRIGTVRAFDRTALQATTDTLTGLSNRRNFESFARSLQRQGTPFALVMADLDHFKLINDTHGHETGDRALVRFAHQLRHHLRADDLVARYGGEEFVILLQHTTAVQAMSILDDFRVKFAAATSSRPPVFTASFGVTDTSAAQTLAELLSQADAALYRAKATGRDTVVIADRPEEADGRERNIERAAEVGLYGAFGDEVDHEVNFDTV